jgi:hypothetical protein
MSEVGERLEEQLGAAEEAGIAGITASELLHSAHRATPKSARPWVGRSVHHVANLA